MRSAAVAGPARAAVSLRWPHLPARMQATWALSVRELEEKYPIRNKPLFASCCVVVPIVLLLFFIHSVGPIHLDLGWVAIMGALTLMLLSGVQEVEAILEKARMHA